MDKDDGKKLRRLIGQMLDEDDDERRYVLADGILELDPGNGAAKYVKWQSMQDGETLDTTLLQEAAAALKPDMENLEEYDGDGEMLYRVYTSILSDLALYSYLSEDHARAFGAASEFMKLDRDGGGLGRDVYFAMLVKRGDFEELLSAVEDDICETPSG